MPCSICRQRGHNIGTCPDGPTPGGVNAARNHRAMNPPAAPARDLHREAEADEGDALRWQRRQRAQQHQRRLEQHQRRLANIRQQQRQQQQRGEEEEEEGDDSPHPSEAETNVARTALLTSHFGGDEDAVPPHFVCPITSELMVHPTVCADGHTYEGAAIRRWLETNRHHRRVNSPTTGAPLRSRALCPNFHLLSQIQNHHHGADEAAAAPAALVARPDALDGAALLIPLFFGM